MTGIARTSITVRSLCVFTYGPRRWKYIAAVRSKLASALHENVAVGTRTHVAMRTQGARLDRLRRLHLSEAKHIRVLGCHSKCHPAAPTADSHLSTLCLPYALALRSREKCLEIWRRKTTYGLDHIPRQDA